MQWLWTVKLIWKKSQGRIKLHVPKIFVKKYIFLIIQLWMNILFYCVNLAQIILYIFLYWNFSVYMLFAIIFFLSSMLSRKRLSHKLWTKQNHLRCFFISMSIIKAGPIKMVTISTIECLVYLFSVLYHMYVTINI